MSSIALFEAKSHLTSLVHQVEDGPAMQLTRHGKSVAVLMGMNEYQSMKNATNSFSAALDKFRSQLDSNDDSQLTDALSGLRDTSEGRPVTL